MHGVANAAIAVQQTVCISFMAQAFPSSQLTTRGAPLVPQSVTSVPAQERLTRQAGTVPGGRSGAPGSRHRRKGRAVRNLRQRRSRAGAAYRYTQTLPSLFRRSASHRDILDRARAVVAVPRRCGRRGAGRQSLPCTGRKYCRPPVQDGLHVIDRIRIAAIIAQAWSRSKPVLSISRHRAEARRRCRRGQNSRTSLAMRGIAIVGEPRPESSPLCCQSGNAGAGRPRRRGVGSFYRCMSFSASVPVVARQVDWPGGMYWNSCACAGHANNGCRRLPTVCMSFSVQASRRRTVQVDCGGYTGTAVPRAGHAYDGIVARFHGCRSFLCRYPRRRTAGRLWRYTAWTAVCAGHANDGIVAGFHGLQVVLRRHPCRHPAGRRGGASLTAVLRRARKRWNCRRLLPFAGRSRCKRPRRRTAGRPWRCNTRNSRAGAGHANNGVVAGFHGLHVVLGASCPVVARQVDRGGAYWGSRACARHATMTCRRLPRFAVVHRAGIPSSHGRSTVAVNPGQPCLRRGHANNGIVASFHGLQVIYRTGVPVVAGQVDCAGVGRDSRVCAGTQTMELSRFTVACRSFSRHHRRRTAGRPWR